MPSAAPSPVVISAFVAFGARDALDAQLARYRSLAQVDARYAPMVARLEATLGALDQAMGQPAA